jgi:hypothetical protein
MSRRSPRGPYKPKSIWHAAAGNVLYYGVLMPISSPFLLKEYIRKNAQSAQESRSENAVQHQRRTEKEALFRKQRDIYKPRELAVSRPRALSLPLEKKGQEKASWSLWSTPQVRQQTIVQSDSLLLTKLPPDIRIKIWELVVGGYTIEVFRGHGRLLHRLQDEDVDDADYGSPMPDYYTDAPRTNLLSLLKTCRQVYVMRTEVEQSDR